MSNSKTWWLQWHHVKPSSKVWSEQLTASAQCSIYHNLFSCSYSCKLGRICVFLFPLILVSILSSPIKVKTNSHIITMTDEQISTSLQWLTNRYPHLCNDWQSNLHIITMTDKQKSPHYLNDWLTTHTSMNSAISNLAGICCVRFLDTIWVLQCLQQTGPNMSTCTALTKHLSSQTETDLPWMPCYSMCLLLSVLVLECRNYVFSVWQIWIDLCINKTINFRIPIWWKL